MKQEQLQIFIQSVVDYFDKVTNNSAEIGVPFIKESQKNILLSYTGVIGISGKMRGAIYFTAGDDFLSALLETIMPGTDKTEIQLSGMVGELANTISGNAQKTLGKNYHISVPIILSYPEPSKKNSLEIQAPTFVIPLRWKSFDAYLVVGLEKDGFSSD